MVFIPFTGVQNPSRPEFELGVLQGEFLSLFSGDVKHMITQHGVILLVYVSSLKIDADFKLSVCHLYQIIPSKYR